MEPFLKAVGGKRWCSAQLAAEIMQIEPALYVEPFVGGGAVALALAPGLDKHVYDANPAFVSVWQVLRVHPPEGILRELNTVERLYPDSAFGYVQARDRLNEYLVGYTRLDSQSAEARRFAALVLYLNVRSFNGLWRVNQEGAFNVPWGKYKQPRRLTLADLTAYHYALTTIAAECLDFRVAFKRLCSSQYRGIRHQIAIFADPPYDSIPDEQGHRTFVNYTAEGFKVGDQCDLAQWLAYLARLGMRVWTTNADTPLIHEIYAWAKIETITEYHSVGAKRAGRGQRKCLLIRG